MSKLDDEVTVMREAAQLARGEEHPLFEALADWWEGEAETLARMEPLVDAFCLAIKHKGGPESYLALGRDEKGDIVMRSDTSSAAARAARIFLDRELT